MLDGPTPARGTALTWPVLDPWQAAAALVWVGGGLAWRAHPPPPHTVLRGVLLLPAVTLLQRAGDGLGVGEHRVEDHLPALVELLALGSVVGRFRRGRAGARS